MKLLSVPAAVLFFCIAFLPPAYADGGFAVRVSDTSSLTEPEQKGIILFRDGVQDLLLEVKYGGAPDEFVWLVPVPSRPEVFVDAAEVFADLDTYVRGWQPPSAVDPWRPWLRNAQLPGPPHEIKASAWDLVVLPPEKGRLRKWIDDHDLDLTYRGRKILDKYVDEGWYFVGMSIDAGHPDAFSRNDHRAGTIQPVRFRFRTAEPVFPLRISAINRDFSNIVLYVYAESALVNRTAFHAAWDQLCFGRAPVPSNLETGAGGDGPNPFLMRLAARFNPDQMKDDVYFEPYSPRVDLRWGDARHQVGALTWIGTTRAAKWNRQVLEAAGRSLSDQVIGAAVWALAKVGGREAVPLVVGLADSRPRIRDEAIRTLLVLDPAAAADLLVTDLKGLSSPFHRWRDQIQRVRFLVDALLSIPDTIEIPGLVALAEEAEGALAWRDFAGRATSDPEKITPGMAAVAVLAARGDPEALATIADAVAAGGGVNYLAKRIPARSPGMMVSVAAISLGGSGESRMHRAERNVLVSDGWSVEPDNWPALGLVERLFRNNGKVRNAILREAAARSGYGEESPVFLLGLMTGESEPEVASVDPGPQR